MDAADKPAMDVSGWLVGSGIAAMAAAAGAWAWARQRRAVAELARRLEASEHSRMDLEVHAHQVDEQLASMAEALARQQATMTAALNVARVTPIGTSTASAGPVRALLQHLGDSEPVGHQNSAGDWIDTEPSSRHDDSQEIAVTAFDEKIRAGSADPAGF